PPLTSLETICAVARAGSLTAAADAAGITHGAVSRRVAAVENWLGVALFERHGRGVRLTTEGQRYVHRLEQAFAIIDGAADQWRTRGNARVVKLSVGASFANMWLLPRLAALELQAPALRIKLDIGSRNADLAAGEADLAVRYGRGAWPNVDVELFMPETLHPVAAPELAAQLRDADAARLLEHPLLHDSDLTGWRAWLAGAGLGIKPRAQDRRFEDYTLVLAAAEAGLGIALARLPLAQGYLARGVLCKVGERAIASPLAYYLATTKKEERPEVVACMARLRATAGA
ncbi:MAG TPA: LysR substrate-binding domain-containing protein, partial [Burkholderiaceae bacterium]